MKCKTQPNIYRYLLDTNFTCNINCFTCLKLCHRKCKFCVSATTIFRFLLPWGNKLNFTSVVIRTNFFCVWGVGIHVDRDCAIDCVIDRLGYCIFSNIGEGRATFFAGWPNSISSKNFRLVKVLSQLFLPTIKLLRCAWCRVHTRWH